MDMPRVVVAAQPQAARLHVANNELIVRRIEVDEAFELAGQGIALERAGEEAPTPEPAAQEPAQSETDRLRVEGTNEGRAPFDAGDEELEGN
jgi:hypothetical protein